MHTEHSGVVSGEKSIGNEECRNPQKGDSGGAGVDIPDSREATFQAMRDRGDIGDTLGTAEDYGF